MGDTLFTTDVRLNWVLRHLRLPPIRYANKHTFKTLVSASILICSVTGSVIKNVDVGKDSFSHKIQSQPNVLLALRLHNYNMRACVCLYVCVCVSVCIYACVIVVQSYIEPLQEKHQRWSRLNAARPRFIVLYLYIYIAPLEVHTNQKCFQCKRPREKREVFRERKEALGFMYKLYIVYLCVFCACVFWVTFNLFLYFYVYTNVCMMYVCIHLFILCN